MTKRAATDNAYERDFYAWANEQAALLRAGRLGEADVGHIAEEIESMGRTEKRELVSRLAVLLRHLLKWRLQPELRSTSWRLTVEEQRLQVESHLDDNPSLKRLLPAAIDEAYRLAVIGARRETGLAAANFPANCPWSFGEIVDDGFWPE